MRETLGAASKVSLGKVVVPRLRLSADCVSGNTFFHGGIVTARTRAWINACVCAVLRHIYIYIYVHTCYDVARVQVKCVYIHTMLSW